MKNISFGIIGCGRIAPKFIKSIERVQNCSVVAVAARDKDRAEEFAKNYCPEATAYGDYEQLCAAENVDAVYIATPHSLHLEHSLLAFKHNKHVLSEKIMTTDMGKLNTMFDEAKKANVLLMEGMWSRFLPVYRSVKTLIDSGELGSITDLELSIGFDAEVFGDESRLNAPQLAGGAIFDIGVYALNGVQSFVDQTPKLIDCKMVRTKLGVDGMSSFTLCYDTFNARLRCSIMEVFDGRIHIKLEKGEIVISDAIRPESYTVKTASGEETFETQAADFSYEIDHFCNLLRRGATDSDVFGRKESTAAMQIIDEFRKEVGLVYPFD